MASDSERSRPPGGGSSAARPDGGAELWLRALRGTALIGVDSAGTVRMFNRGAERLLGYASADVEGRMLPENFHSAAEAAEVRALFARIRNGGPDAAETREWTFVRKDGVRFPVTLTVTGVYDAAGRLVGFLGEAEDVSRRRALEASLRQAQVSVDNSWDMILWLRLDDARIVFCNRAARVALGYEGEEMLRLSAMDFEPLLTPERWAAHCGELRRRGRLIVQTNFRRKGGEMFPVEISASLAEHGGEEFCLGVVRDVSERRELLARLHQASLSVNNAQEMILWLRLDDGRIVFVNRAVCRNLGYSGDELIGADSALINPAAAEGADLRATCRTLRELGRTRFETVFRRKDGSEIPVEVGATCVSHEGLDYAVGIARDVSQRKEAEALLRAETRLNRILAESARALLGAERDMRAIARVLLDRACELTGSRHGYVAFIDQEHGALHSRAMRSLLKSDGCTMGTAAGCRRDSAGAYPGLWGHCLNTRFGFYTNDPARHSSAHGLPQGHLPIVRLLAVPALAKGRIVGQIAVANAERDYTDADLAAVEALADVFALGAERALSRHALRLAKDAAETSSRAKSAFLANMTHEVRTPLNGILGMLQVLLAGALSPDQREYVGVAMESADRLNRLLDNVIEFARLDSELSPADCMSFSPRDVLRSLEARFAPRAREKGLAFSVASEANLPEILYSDPQALNSILGHLLDNAVKFTAEGSVALRAGLDAADPAQVVFRVEDSGIGIPGGKRGQVFEAFAQADASVTRTYGGAGLGLAIATRLAGRLKGVLATGDREGGGTVMILTIPRDCSALLEE